MNDNDRGGSSPELFDLSGLGEGLAAPSPRKCRTPESFLGPEGASLVNLDSLIPVNASAKTTNPFLSGDYGQKIDHFQILVTNKRSNDTQSCFFFFFFPL